MGSTTKKGNTANPGLGKAAEVPPPSSGAQGALELTIHGTTSGDLYLGWTPTKCALRATNNPGSARNVVLKNRNTSGGQVVFRTSYAGPEADTLALTVPGDGTPVEFYVGGKFGSPSSSDQDGGIAIHDAATDTSLHQRTVMVRVRKDANSLTDEERDRFLTAFAKINAKSATYQIFLDSHNAAADGEIHGRPSFLPWHRAFILSLERLLQREDASVSLPYWRFDLPAPKLFTEDFMGGDPDGSGRVAISGTNPLNTWKIGAVDGIYRTPTFDRVAAAPTLLSQVATLALGSTFRNFRRMEGNPHGSAHVAFFPADINDPATATKDPLFFLLHCNVDRLWALWQLANDRWNPADIETYDPFGETGPGDQLAHTMWPWNGVTTPPRPSSAPGRRMPQLTFQSMPSEEVTVQETIDYIGKVEGNTHNYDYDDVPFL